MLGLYAATAVEQHASPLSSSDRNEPRLALVLQGPAMDPTGRQRAVEGGPHGADRPCTSAAAGEQPLHQSVRGRRTASRATPELRTDYGGKYSTPRHEKAANAETRLRKPVPGVPEQRTGSLLSRYVRSRVVNLRWVRRCWESLQFGQSEVTEPTESVGQRPTRFFGPARAGRRRREPRPLPRLIAVIARPLRLSGQRQGAGEDGGDQKPDRYQGRRRRTLLRRVRDALSRESGRGSALLQEPYQEYALHVEIRTTRLKRAPAAS